MCDFVPVGIAFQVHFRCSKGNQAPIRYKALLTWASRWRSAQATRHTPLLVRRKPDGVRWCVPAHAQHGAGTVS